jgi:hypothetical protein
MIDIKSIFAAVLLELGASYLLIDVTSGTPQYLAFLSTHATASALLAWGSHFALPPRFRTPRVATLAYLFCFTFFIPLFGLAGIIGAIVITRLLPRGLIWEPYAEVKAPEYVLSIREPEAIMRLSGLKHTLLDTDLPSAVRLKSLIALQNMPARVAGPMLRALLGDPADDIRLLAYSMIDSQEKRINARIDEERSALEAAKDRAQRLGARRQLAELNWELVYTGLVQGDVRDHALAQARTHIEAAVELASHDPGLWFLKGRILHAYRGEHLDAAAQAYSVAVSCGMAEGRVLPYMAEIAFERRDFSMVRELIGATAGNHATPTMAPLARYWQGLCRI